MRRFPAPPPAHNHPSHVEQVAAAPAAVRMEVTRVTFKRGTGCCEESPVRMVTAYFADDGQKLAERDPQHEAYRQLTGGAS